MNMNTLTEMAIESWAAINGLALEDAKREVAENESAQNQVFMLVCAAMAEEKAV